MVLKALFVFCMNVLCEVEDLRMRQFETRVLIQIYRFFFNIKRKDIENEQTCLTPFLSTGCIFSQDSSWCKPELSSREMKGCCGQYTIVHFYQRQEAAGLDVYLNSSTSCPCSHVFNSLFILIWQINRYGWTHLEGNFPLI